MKSSYALVFFACALGLVHIVKSGGGDHYHDCSLAPDNGYSCSSEMGSSSGAIGSSGEPETWYYFVIEDSMCYPFQFYGCGGNTNRFNDSTICETYCLLQGEARPFTTDSP